MRLHKMTKTPILETNSEIKCPKESPNIFSQHFDHYNLIDTISLYYHMQY